ncbi:hypothetical protein ACFV2H_37720 [Streptomyces sp. NPDC059629]|uniref:WXG100-like domain-containing protein n=1 Tax=Streptomyces sp. NPDC059629 TaxID=3346889 RepID=UPI0036B42A82
MAIELPSGLAGLFKLITGMPWPQGNEDELRQVAQLYTTTSQEFDQLAEVVSELVAAIKRDFQGETASAFVASMQDLVSGDDYLGAAKEGASELADFANDTANQLEYMKWMIIATLVELAAELAFYAATAWFNPFAEAEALIAEMFARIFINKIVATVLRYIAQHVVLGLITAVTMDRLIQAIQKRQGHRKSYDNSLLVQAVEFSVIGGVTGAVLGPLAGKFGSWLSGLMGKDFGKTVGDDLANVFKSGLGPLTTQGETKAFTKDLGRVIGDNGHGLANGFGKDVRDEVGGGLGAGAGRGPGGRAGSGEVSGVGKDAVPSRGAGNELSEADKFRNEMGEVFSQHLGPSAGTAATERAGVTGLVARMAGEEFGEKFAEVWGRKPLSEVQAELKKVLIDSGLTKEVSEELSREIPDAVLRALVKNAGPNVGQKLAELVTASVSGGVNMTLTTGFYNLIFGPDHSFETNFDSFVGGAAMGALGHGGRMAIDRLSPHTKIEVPEIEARDFEKDFGEGLAGKRSNEATGTGDEGPLPPSEPPTGSATVTNAPPGDRFSRPGVRTVSGAAGGGSGTGRGSARTAETGAGGVSRAAGRESVAAGSGGEVPGSGSAPGVRTTGRGLGGGTSAEEGQAAPAGVRTSGGGRASEEAPGSREPRMEETEPETVAGSERPATVAGVGGPERPGAGAGAGAGARPGTESESEPAVTGARVRAGTAGTGRGEPTEAGETGPGGRSGRRGGGAQEDGEGPASVVRTASAGSGGSAGTARPGGRGDDEASQDPSAQVRDVTSGSGTRTSTRPDARSAARGGKGDGTTTPDTSPRLSDGLADPVGRDGDRERGPGAELGDDVDARFAALKGLDVPSARRDDGLTGPAGHEGEVEHGPGAERDADVDDLAARFAALRGSDVPSVRRDDGPAGPVGRDGDAEHGPGAEHDADVDALETRLAALRGADVPSAGREDGPAGSVGHDGGVGDGPGAERDADVDAVGARFDQLNGLNTPLTRPGDGSAGSGTRDGDAAHGPDREEDPRFAKLDELSVKKSLIDVPSVPTEAPVALARVSDWYANRLGGIARDAGMSGADRSTHLEGIRDAAKANDWTEVAQRYGQFRDHVDLAILRRRIDAFEAHVKDQGENGFAKLARLGARRDEWQAKVDAVHDARRTGDPDAQNAALRDYTAYVERHVPAEVLTGKDAPHAYDTELNRVLDDLKSARGPGEYDRAREELESLRETNELQDRLDALGPGLGDEGQALRRLLATTTTSDEGAAMAHALRELREEREVAERLERLRAGDAGTHSEVIEERLSALRGDSDAHEVELRRRVDEAADAEDAVEALRALHEYREAREAQALQQRLNDLDGSGVSGDPAGREAVGGKEPEDRLGALGEGESDPRVTELRRRVDEAVGEDEADQALRALHEYREERARQRLLNELDGPETVSEKELQDRLDALGEGESDPQVVELRRQAREATSPQEAAGILDRLEQHIQRQEELRRARVWEYREKIARLDEERTEHLLNGRRDEADELRKERDEVQRLLDDSLSYEQKRSDLAVEWSRSLDRPEAKGHLDRIIDKALSLPGTSGDPSPRDHEGDAPGHRADAPGHEDNRPRDDREAADDPRLPTPPNTPPGVTGTHDDGAGATGRDVPQPRVPEREPEREPESAPEPQELTLQAQKEESETDTTAPLPDPVDWISEPGLHTDEPRAPRADEEPAAPEHRGDGPHDPHPATAQTVTSRPGEDQTAPAHAPATEHDGPLDTDTDTDHDPLALDHLGSDGGGVREADGSLPDQSGTDTHDTVRPDLDRLRPTEHDGRAPERLDLDRPGPDDRAGDAPDRLDHVELPEDRQVHTAPPVDGGLVESPGVPLVVGSLYASGEVRTDRWIPFGGGAEGSEAFRIESGADGSREILRPSASGERTDVGYVWRRTRGETATSDVLTFTRRIHLRPAGATPEDLAWVREGVADGVERLLNEPGHRLPVDQPDRVTGPQVPGPVWRAEVDFVDSPEQAHSVVDVYPGMPDPGEMVQDAWYAGLDPTAYVHEVVHGFGVWDDVSDPRTLLVPGGRGEQVPTEGGTSLMGPVTDDTPRPLRFELTPDHLAQIADVFRPYAHAGTLTPQHGTPDSTTEREPDVRPAAPGFGLGSLFGSRTPAPAEVQNGRFSFVNLSSARPEFVAKAQRILELLTAHGEIGNFLGRRPARIVLVKRFADKPADVVSDPQGVTVHLAAYYFEQYSIGYIMGMLAHEFGIHPVASSYRKVLEEEEELFHGFPVPVPGLKLTHVMNSSTAKQRDHVLGAIPGAPRFEVFKRVALNMARTLLNHMYANPESARPADVTDLFDTFLMDLASTAATNDNRQAGLSTTRDGHTVRANIATAYNAYKADLARDVSQLDLRLVPLMPEDKTADDVTRDYMTLARRAAAGLLGAPSMSHTVTEGSDAQPGLPAGQHTHAADSVDGGLVQSPDVPVVTGSLYASGEVRTDRWIPFGGGAEGSEAFRIESGADGSREILRPSASGERTDVGYVWRRTRGETATSDVLTFTRRIHLRPAGATPEDLAWVREGVADGVERLLNEPGHRLPVDQPDRVTGPQVPGPVWRAEVEFVDSPEQAHSVVDVYPGMPDPGEMVQDAWYAGLDPTAYVHEVVHGFGVWDDVSDPRTLLVPGGRGEQVPTEGGTSLMGPVTDDTPRPLRFELTPDHLAQIADVFRPYAHAGTLTPQHGTPDSTTGQEPDMRPAAPGVQFFKQGDHVFNALGDSAEKLKKDILATAGEVVKIYQPQKILKSYQSDPAYPVVKEEIDRLKNVSQASIARMTQLAEQARELREPQGQREGYQAAVSKGSGDAAGDANSQLFGGFVERLRVLARTVGTGDPATGEWGIPADLRELATDWRRLRPMVFDPDAYSTKRAELNRKRHGDFERWVAETGDIYIDLYRAMLAALSDAHAYISVMLNLQDKISALQAAQPTVQHPVPGGRDAASTSTAVPSPLVAGGPGQRTAGPAPVQTRVLRPADRVRPEPPLVPRAPMAPAPAADRVLDAVPDRVSDPGVVSDRVPVVDVVSVGLWDVVRGAVVPRRVERVWVDPVSEPAGSGVHAPRYAVYSGFDVRSFEVGGRSVTDLTVRVRLDGDGLPSAEVDALWGRARDGVERVFNRPGGVLPDGSVLHVSVERVSGADEYAHLSVTVGGEGSELDQLRWPVDATEQDLAHEMGHQLGLRDEYVDATAKHRPEISGSLMGDYHAPAPEGLSQGGLRERYLQLIHDQITNTPHTPGGDRERDGAAVPGGGVVEYVVPRAMTGQSIVANIPGHGDGTPQAPHRFLGGFPFGVGSLNGANNLISRPLYLRVPGASMYLAVHLNVTLTASNESPMAGRGGKPLADTSHVTVRGEKFHLTARPVLTQDVIERYGSSILSAEISVHRGPNNTSGWDSRTRNTDALAAVLGVSRAVLLTSLEQAYPQDKVVAVREQFRGDLHRRIVGLAHAGTVYVTLDGDQSFQPQLAPRAPRAPRAPVAPAPATGIAPRTMTGPGIVAAESGGLPVMVRPNPVEEFRPRKRVERRPRVSVIANPDAEGVESVGQTRVPASGAPPASRVSSRTGSVPTPDAIFRPAPSRVEDERAIRELGGRLETVLPVSREPGGVGRAGRGEDLAHAPWPAEPGPPAEAVEEPTGRGSSSVPRAGVRQSATGRPQTTDTQFFDAPARHDDGQDLAASPTTPGIGQVTESRDAGDSADSRAERPGSLPRVKGDAVGGETAVADEREPSLEELVFGLEDLIFDDFGPVVSDPPAPVVPERTDVGRPGEDTGPPAAPDEESAPSVRPPWYVNHGMLGESTVVRVGSWAEHDTAAAWAGRVVEGLPGSAELRDEVRSKLEEMLSTEGHGDWDNLLFKGKFLTVGKDLVWLRPELVDVRPTAAPQGEEGPVRRYAVRWASTNASTERTRSKESALESVLFLGTNIASAAASTAVVGLPTLRAGASAEVSASAKRNVISGRKVFVEKTNTFDADLRFRVFVNGEERLQSGPTVPRRLTVDFPRPYSGPGEPQRVVSAAPRDPGTGTQRPRLAGEVLNAIDLTPLLAETQKHLIGAGLSAEATKRTVDKIQAFVNERTARNRSVHWLTSGDTSNLITSAKGAFSLPGQGVFSGHFRIKASIESLQLVTVSEGVRIREDLGGGLVVGTDRKGGSSVTTTFSANVMGLVDPELVAHHPHANKAKGMAPLLGVSIGKERGAGHALQAQALTHTILNATEPHARYRAVLRVEMDWRSTTHPSLRTVSSTATGDLGVPWRHGEGPAELERRVLGAVHTPFLNRVLDEARAVGASGHDDVPTVLPGPVESHPHVRALLRESGTEPTRMMGRPTRLDEPLPEPHEREPLALATRRGLGLAVAAALPGAEVVGDHFRWWFTKNTRPSDLAALDRQLDAHFSRAALQGDLSAVLAGVRHTVTVRGKRYELSVQGTLRESRNVTSYTKTVNQRTAVAETVSASRDDKWKVGAGAGAAVRVGINHWLRATIGGFRLTGSVGGGRDEGFSAVSKSYRRLENVTDVDEHTLDIAYQLSVRLLDSAATNDVEKWWIDRPGELVTQVLVPREHAPSAAVGHQEIAEAGRASFMRSWPSDAEPRMDFSSGTSGLYPTFFVMPELTRVAATLYGNNLGTSSRRWLDNSAYWPAELIRSTRPDELAAHFGHLTSESGRTVSLPDHDGWKSTLRLRLRSYNPRRQEMNGETEIEQYTQSHITHSTADGHDLAFGVSAAAGPQLRFGSDSGNEVELGDSSTGATAVRIPGGRIALTGHVESGVGWSKKNAEHKGFIDITRATYAGTPDGFRADAVFEATVTSWKGSQTKTLTRHVRFASAMDVLMPPRRTQDVMPSPETGPSQQVVTRGYLGGRLLATAAHPEALHADGVLEKITTRLREHGALATGKDGLLPDLLLRSLHARFSSEALLGQTRALLASGVTGWFPVKRFGGAMEYVWVRVSAEQVHPARSHRSRDEVSLTLRGEGVTEEKESQNRLLTSGFGGALVARGSEQKYEGHEGSHSGPEQQGHGGLDTEGGYWSRTSRGTAATGKHLDIYRASPKDKAEEFEHELTFRIEVGSSIEPPEVLRVPARGVQALTAGIARMVGPRGVADRIWHQRPAWSWFSDGSRPEEKAQGDIRVLVPRHLTVETDGRAQSPYEPQFGVNPSWEKTSESGSGDVSEGLKELSETLHPWDLPAAAAVNRWVKVAASQAVRDPDLSQENVRQVPGLDPTSVAGMAYDHHTGQGMLRPQITALLQQKYDVLVGGRKVRVGFHVNAAHPIGPEEGTKFKARRYQQNEPETEVTSGSSKGWYAGGGPEGGGEAGDIALLGRMPVEFARSAGDEAAGGVSETEEHNKEGVRAFRHYRFDITVVAQAVSGKGPARRLKVDVPGGLFGMLPLAEDGRTLAGDLEKHLPHLFRPAPAPESPAPAVDTADPAVDTADPGSKVPGIVEPAPAPAAPGAGTSAADPDVKTPTVPEHAPIPEASGAGTDAAGADVKPSAVSGPGLIREVTTPDRHHVMEPLETGPTHLDFAFEQPRFSLDEMVLQVLNGNTPMTAPVGHAETSGEDFQGFFHEEAARRGMTLQELETRMYAPDSVLMPFAFSRPQASLSTVYRELATEGLPGVCGETSRRLFDITSESTARRVTGLDALFHELHGPGNANLRVTTAGHSFFVEKRGDTVRLLQSYIGNYSLVENLERAPRMRAGDFVTKLQDIVSAYQDVVDNGGTVGRSIIHEAESELFGGKLFSATDFGTGEGQGLNNQLVTEVATGFRDSAGQREALGNLLGESGPEAWDGVRESDETLSTWLQRTFGWDLPDDDFDPVLDGVAGDGSEITVETPQEPNVLVAGEPETSTVPSIRDPWQTEPGTRSRSLSPEAVPVEGSDATPAAVPTLHPDGATSVSDPETVPVELDVPTSPAVASGLLHTSMLGEISTPIGAPGLPREASQAGAAVPDGVPVADLASGTDWGAARDAVLPRPVAHVWVDPISRPVGGLVPRYEVRSGFDVRSFEVGGRSVTDLTVRVRLRGEGRSSAEVDALWDRARGGVERVFNAPGGVLPDGSVLHVSLERVMGESDHAHLGVTVGGERSGLDQRRWPVDASEQDLVHEVGHQLGLRDEHPDATARHRPDVAGSLMGDYSVPAPRGLSQGGLRDRYLQLIHAQIVSAAEVSAAVLGSGRGRDDGAGQVSRTDSDALIGVAPRAPHGEERQEREVVESDLTDRMRRWLDRDATMKATVRVKDLHGLRYAAQPNWTPETRVAVGALNLSYADRAALVGRVRGLNDELAAALYKPMEPPAPPRVLVQGGFARGDQFGIATALIADPNLHVLLVSGIEGKPDFSDAIAVFYKESGVPSSRVHRIAAGRGQSADEAGREKAIRILDDVSPRLTPQQKQERVLKVRDGTRWVAHNFNIGVRRAVRKAWRLDDAGFPPDVQQAVGAWLARQGVSPSRQKDTIVLWSRFSGKRGGAHAEHDTSYEAVRQILSQLTAESRKRGEKPLVVIAGDAHADPRHADKYQKIVKNAREQGLDVRDLTNFWKGDKTGLRTWGGDNRIGQFKLYEYLHRNSRSTRHLGFRSGNAEALALIGHNVTYLEEAGAQSASRMEQWHAARNSLRTVGGALAPGYERILVKEPLTRTGKLMTRLRDRAMSPNDLARMGFLDYRNPPWLFAAPHRQPKPQKLFDQVKSGLAPEDLRQIIDYLLPGEQPPVAPVAPVAAGQPGHARRAGGQKPTEVPVTPVAQARVNAGEPSRQQAAEHMEQRAMHDRRAADEALRQVNQQQAALRWADEEQRWAAEVQRHRAGWTAAKNEAAAARREAERARAQAAQHRRAAVQWDMELGRAKAVQQAADQRTATAQQLIDSLTRAAQEGRLSEQAARQLAAARLEVAAAQQAAQVAAHRVWMAPQHRLMSEHQAEAEDLTVQRAEQTARAAEQTAEAAERAAHQAAAAEQAAEAQRLVAERAAQQAAAQRVEAERAAQQAAAQHVAAPQHVAAAQHVAAQRQAEAKPAPSRKNTYQDGDFSDSDEVENLVPDDASFFGAFKDRFPKDVIHQALAEFPGRRTTDKPQPVAGFGKSRFGLRPDKIPVSRTDRFRTLRYRQDEEPLYRYDTRHYDTIFNEGFRPWNGKAVRSLAHYQAYRQRTAMVSTSRSHGDYVPPWAMAPDGTANLYVIKAPGGIDMIDSLRRRALYTMHEVVFWKGVRPTFVDRVEIVQQIPGQNARRVVRIITRDDWMRELEGGGRTLQDGSWRGPGGMTLTAEVNRLASSLWQKSNLWEPRITVQIESYIRKIKHLKLSSDVKEEHSLKRKLATQLHQNPGLSAEGAVEKFGDAVRYTIKITREDKYTKRVGEIVDQLRQHGHTLLYYRNSWKGSGYRGINSVWFDQASQLYFEIQFHTGSSLDARDAAHILYEVIRVPGADPKEKAANLKEQEKIFGRVPVPAGAPEIEL